MSGMLRMRRQLLGGGGLAQPTAMFNFTTGVLDPRITYTHGSANSWWFDASGVLVSYPTTSPRWDYGPMGGGTLRGLRIDNTLSNVVLHNRDLTNAVWTKTDATAAKDAVGLTGDANSCSTLTATGAGGKATQALTAASAVRTFSIWIKRKTGTGTVSITLDDGATTTDVTSQINSLTFTLVYAQQTLANPVIGVILATSGDEVYVDAAQIEAAGFSIPPTSPVLTAGSAVQRTRDDTNVTGVNFSSWFNAVEGTFVADFIVDIPSLAGGTFRRQVFQVDDTTTNERMTGWASNNSTSNNMSGQITDGGSAVMLIDATVKPTAGIRQRIGLAYKANDSNFARNGTAGTPDASVTLPTVTQLRMGGMGATAEQLIGVLQRVRYWNYRVPDGMLAALTAL